MKTPKVYVGTLFTKHGQHYAVCAGTQKAIAQATGASLGHIKSHWTQTGNAAQIALAMSPLFVVDTSQSTDSIRAHLARMAQRGEPVEFVVIDYLDMLQDEGGAANEEKRVGRIARAAKRIARDYDCCVWLLHAMNRRDEISLRSLKYGGDYDAD